MSEPSRFERLAARLRAISIAAALLPVGVAAVRAIEQGWVPISENALYAIRARDVFTHHVPLVGTLAGAAGGNFSNQPGALLFDVLALPVTLLGGDVGVVVGVSLINAASLLGIALLAQRRGGPLVATAAMAAATALTWTMGSTMLYEPWNPHSVILPFLCFVLLSWSVACGDAKVLPWMVGVGSLVAQTHLSYVLLVPALAGGAIVAFGFERRRLRGVDERAWRRLRMRTRRAGALAAIVLVVCWAQPVADQFISDGPGNLTRLAQSADGSGPTMGYSLGTRSVASVVSLPPWWFRPSFRRAFVVFEGWRAPSTTGAVASLVLVGAALAWCVWDARRRRDRIVALAAATAGLAVGVGLLTAARAPLGAVAFLRISPHVLRWLWPVGAFVTFTIAMALARRWARDSRREVTAVGLFTAVTGVLAILNLPASTQSLGPSQNNATIPAVRALSREMVSLESEGPLLADDVYRLGVGDAWSGPVLAELQRREIPFVVENPGLVRQYGDARRFTGANARAALLIRIGDETRIAPAGSRRVAGHDGITKREQRELAVLERQISDHIRERGLRLSPRGQQALERGDLPVLRRQPEGQVEPEALFTTGELRRMVRDRLVVTVPPWAQRFERYADLQGRWDTMTVALFVRPLAHS